MHLVRFTNSGGDCIYINPDAVVLVREVLPVNRTTNENTVIVCENDRWAVKEDLDTVLHKLKGVSL